MLIDVFLFFFIGTFFGVLCALLAKAMEYNITIFFLIGFFLHIVGLTVTVIIYLITLFTKEAYFINDYNK